MEKEFIPYELASKMKQLGFDEPCFGYYLQNKRFISYEERRAMPKQTKDAISFPLFQQAFRWFREKYGLASQFTYYHVPKWTFEILEFTEIKMTPSKVLCEYSEPRTYEEAELACLKKLIEIVEQRNAEMTEHGVYK